MPQNQLELFLSFLFMVRRRETYGAVVLLETLEFWFCFCDLDFDCVHSWDLVESSVVRRLSVARNAFAGFKARSVTLELVLLVAGDAPRPVFVLRGVRSFGRRKGTLARRHQSYWLLQKIKGSNSYFLNLLFRPALSQRISATFH